MEVRCGQCNKLYRVSDDKITGTGIKFTCSQCGEYVKITMESFQQYQLSREAAPAMEAPAPPDVLAPPPQPPVAEADYNDSFAGFDIVEEKETPAAVVLEEPIAEPASPPPLERPAPPAQPKPAPAAPQPKPSPKPAAPAPTTEKVETAPSASVETTAPAAPAAEPSEPSLVVTETVSSSGSGGKLFSWLLILLLLGGGGYWAYRTFLASPGPAGKGAAEDPLKGLNVTQSLASWDSTTGDLVLDMTLENATDSARTTWYVVAEIFDASGTVLATARMLNGKQLYSRQDYDALALRNINVEEFKQQQRSMPDLTLPARTVISIELRVINPPAGVSGFAATFQPADPRNLPSE